MQPIDLMIFDLDGTLVDTRQDLANAVNHALRELALPEQPLEQIMANVGNGMHKLLQRTLPANRHTETKRALDLFRAYYGEHLLDHSRLYPGMQEVLDRFSHKKLAVVSNKPEKFSKAVVAGLGLADRFMQVVGGDTLPTLKPSPEPLLAVTERLQVPAGNAVMIGDGPSDIEAGKAAGTFTCAVTYGYRSRELLTAANPDLLVDSAYGILDAFC